MGDKRDKSRSKKRSKKGKIQATPPQQTPLIRAQQAHSQLLRFSFRHLDLNADGFDTSEQSADYFVKLLGRLKDLGGMRTQEVISNRSPSLRSHTITWSDTSQPDGFTHLNAQLQAIEPYQITLSANAYGRIHGFFLNDTFYVVWLDPNHVVYPGA